jgi:uncharacterized membrane protein YphA (DoxX/SURF4 family)
LKPETRNLKPWDAPVGGAAICSHNRQNPLVLTFASGGAKVTDSSYRIGWFAAAALVALRVGIGVHFLAEGLDKLADPKPFSAPFFGGAKGPLASVYKGLVWDPDGLYRLDSKTAEAEWDNFRNRLVGHYGFDEEQTKRAEAALSTYRSRLNQFIAANSDKIDEYYLRLERRKKNEQDPARNLASLQAHDAKINTELARLRGELVPTIDGLWRDLENDLNAIATQEQWVRHGRLAIGKPGRRSLDSLTLDAIIPYFNVAVGVCLILGVFTRVAALLGAAFLATVCATQWPGSPGAIPIYYQIVEMLALVVLAAIGAGRYLGIDYLLGGLKSVFSSPKKQGTAK